MSPVKQETYHSGNFRGNIVLIWWQLYRKVERRYAITHLIHCWYLVFTFNLTLTSSQIYEISVMLAAVHIFENSLVSCLYFYETYHSLFHRQPSKPAQLFERRFLEKNCQEEAYSDDIDLKLVWQIARLAQAKRIQVKKVNKWPISHNICEIYSLKQSHRKKLWLKKYSV